MTEAYLEGYKLDLSKDFSTKINFAIDDIKDFAERSTAWSNQVVLPGTANNNKLLGNIFDIGHSNSYNPNLPNVGHNFNAAKAASVVVFQDNIQAFKGVLRLLEIISDKGAIEYEVALFGDLTLLNAKLAAGYLSDLDFSAYNHTYNLTNIVNSWDNTGGAGYYYPLIDHGNYGINNKHDWGIRTFRPALYAKEYLDKMFAEAGFRYDCSLFNTTRFKKLVIPCNRKYAVKRTDVFLSRTGSGPYFASSTYGIQFGTVVSSGEFTETLGDQNRWIYTYVGSSEIVGTIKINFNLSYEKGTGYEVRINTYVNGSVVDNTKSISSSSTSGNFTYSYTLPSVALNNGSEIEVRVFRAGSVGDQFTFDLNWASLIVEAKTASLVPVGLNEPFQINENIPQNIRQVDFLKSIVQLFNLYVHEDKFDSRLIHITPYIDFVDTNQGSAKDWTYKLNRDKPVRVKPLSELNSKVYEFKFKPDGDFYNDQYKKRYNQGYGDMIYDSEFEFSGGKKSLELIFSATPLVGYQGEDKVYSTVFKKSGDNEEPTDSNIRILQSKKIAGVSSWNIVNDQASNAVLGSYTSYPYAGHFDDPDAPTNDLNFGVSKELFFTLVGGNLSTTQFNVYWSPYMAEITDKDSKLLTGKFYLTSKDINELDFSKPIYMDGVLYRLNKISEYNASEPDECAVELFKINYLQY